MQATREPGLWKRGVLWLLLLAPVFFASYGFANWFTAQRENVGSLAFAWEQHLPLWPWTIVPYWSIDLLYGLSFLLPLTRREMDRHALRLLSAQILCIACFLLWPLRFSFERPELSGVFGWLFDVLMGFDKPYNQAPSLHITLLVIIWAMFSRHAHTRWLKILVHGWMALIGLSVLTTWQHHFIDVPTGIAAGWLCVWLWPLQGETPLAQARWTHDRKRLKLALYYLLGSLLLLAAALFLGGLWLILLWPALSLLLVAIFYALVGAAGFQKQADGRLSRASTWLLAPYLVGAWINSRAWTRRQPEAQQVIDDVWLGRIPGRGDTAAFGALIDLCAELPVDNAGKAYCSIPVLDLTAPDAATCLRAAEAIEQLRQQGSVLVFCALGYSRSACAVAAWLLYSGRCDNIDQALELIRRVRPSIVLGPEHRKALQSLQEGFIHE